MASLDLRKAFDRIEYTSLFTALREQGIDDDYLALLASVYAGQSGCVRGSPHFPITRGVNQGDIISPILFNAALESVVRRWKMRIGQCGVNDGIEEKLTNIRYADDLMIYANTIEDLRYMLEVLFDELGACGLQINAAKCKILTVNCRSPLEGVCVNGECIKILRDICVWNIRMSFKTLLR